MNVLQRFHATHPAQHLFWGSTSCEYWAGGHGAPALLLLGGGMSFGDTNHHLVTLFESTRRVLSPSYPPVTTVREVTDALLELLDREHVDRADLFGHSLGAGIAHAFVRLHPDRVDRLALSSFGLYTRGHVLSVRLFLAAMRVLPYSALRGYYGRALHRAAAQAGPERVAELEAVTRQLFARHTRDSALGQLGLLDDLFRRRDAYRLDEPEGRPGRVLLLFANDDRGFTRAEQDALARTYPGATVSRFVTGGHLIGLTHPQELEHKLELFFRPARAAHAPVLAPRPSA